MKPSKPILILKTGCLFLQDIQDFINKYWGPEGQNIRIKAILGSWDSLAKKDVIDQWITFLSQLKGKITLYNNVRHFIEEGRFREIANSILHIVNL